MTRANATAEASLDRLNLVVSPLRRALLRAARAAQALPDLPDAQIEVLRAFANTPRRSPGELAQELGLSRSTISNLLRTMETEGLVQRTTHTTDARRVEVSPTPKADDLLTRFDDASVSIVRQALNELSEAERTVLAEAIPVLEQLREIIETKARRGR